MYCRKCNGPRNGNICFKCGSDTKEVSDHWHEPELPDVDKIRALAKEVGYAIGVHGSQLRDLDLIAAPWTLDAVDPYELVQHIARNMIFNEKPAEVMGFTYKPLGRIAFTIVLHGWFKPVDLSVCPRT